MNENNVEKLECPHCGCMNAYNMVFEVSDGSITCEACKGNWMPGNGVDVSGIIKKSWNRFSSLPSVRDNAFVDVRDRSQAFSSDKGASIIHIRIQNGPRKEVGENGADIDLLGQIWLDILKQFEERMPCEENLETIWNVENALAIQDQRRKRRIAEQTEGLYK